MNEELLLEILKQYRKQYNHVNEICRITRDLETALQRNDTVSVQLLLGMRGEEMAEADGCRKNIGSFQKMYKRKIGSAWSGCCVPSLR